MLKQRLEEKKKANAESEAKRLKLDEEFAAKQKALEAEVAKAKADAVELAK